MQWLIELETNADPISACRLMNIFRRKGLKLEALALGMSQRLGGFGFSLLALVDFMESELGHVFNYLRRTEGVEGVKCYRHDESAEACFILLYAEGRSALEIISEFPGAKLIVSSFGKYLLEAPPGTRASAGDSEIEYQRFACVMSTEDATRTEPIGAVTQR